MMSVTDKMKSLKMIRSKLKSNGPFSRVWKDFQYTTFIRLECHHVICSVQAHQLPDS